MPTLLNTPVTRPFDSAGELSSLNINNGWSVSGGKAISSSTTMAGTARRFMLDAGANWAGVVEADIEIQNGVGLVLGAPASSPDGGTGIYFGIFQDPDTGGYYFKLWSEAHAATGNWRDTRLEYVTEANCYFAAGTAVTFKLGARSTGWYVSANGREILWIKSYGSDRTGTIAAARTGVRLGAWATVAGATINRLVTSYAKNRDYPLSIQTIFYDTMSSQTNGAAWNPALANPTVAQSPFSPGSSYHTISGGQLSLSAVSNMIGGDGDTLDMNAWGISYYFEFQYISGTVVAQWQIGGAFQVAVNGNLSGTQQGLQLLLPAAGKGGASYLETYNPAIGSGTYIQIRVIPQYAPAQVGYTPYVGTSTVSVWTGSTIDGPWTQRIVNVSNISAGYHLAMSMGNGTPSNAGVVDNIRLRRGPHSSDIGGTWPYDYVMNNEGPGESLVSGAAGRPGLLYRGGDLISRMVEAG